MGIEVRLLDRSRCRVLHRPSGAVVETDAAPEFGGGGTGLSSTDLVAAALGSCVGSSIAPIVDRAGLDLSGVSIRVSKRLARNPNRIASLEVTVDLPPEADEQLIAKVRNAARSCAVHRSLAVEVRFVVA